MVDEPSDGAGAAIARHSLADLVKAPGRPVERIVQCGACGEGVERKGFGLRCRSCGAVLVRDSDLAEPVRPDGVLPFAVDEEAARSAFANWIAHRRFAPQSLRSGSMQVSSVDGLFLPFWSFSAATRSAYRGRRGETDTQQVMRTRADAEGKSETYWETETVTRWHHVSGQVSRDFVDLRLSACSPLTEKAPRWPLTGLRPYAQGSARGKRIIAYDVDPGSGLDTAKKLMRAQIESDVRRDIGGSSQQVNGVDTTYTRESCSLVLLPAWLISYTHQGKPRSALVNGSSGEVAGERPYSAAKISLLIGVAAAIAIAITLLAVLH